jgi:hypothetical protein
VRAYLAQIDRVRRSFEAARAATAKALGQVHPARPDHTWAVAARALGRSRSVYTGLAAETSGIRPPAGLETAHRGLATSLRLLGTYAGRVADALAARSRAKLAAAVADRTLPRHAEQLRSQWRAALVGYAQGAGVTLPPWARSS